MAPMSGNRGGRRAAPIALVGVLLALAIAACGGQDPSPRLTDEALGAMIDSLLPEISRASGLEARRPVRYSVQSTAEVREFVERQLEDELGPEELAGAERAYRLFGLIPDTLDLRSLLLELYSEQVVGYYDPETDRLYVVEGVSADSAESVVAHELVHALQDQHTPLDSLIARDRGNDRQMAAQAAAEGQATVVMIALETSRRTGQSLDPSDLPDLGGMMEAALEAQGQQFPVFERAPRVIRETLVFPYFGGAAFVQALHAARGTIVPFGDQLPQSTEQVLEPERAFLGGRDAPTQIELGEAPSGWEIAYSNTLGQLETRIMLDEWLGAEGRPAATGWDGDQYAVLDGPEGQEALVWYSVWDDDAGADRFARAYRAVLEQRPGQTGRVERMEVEGRPVVRVRQARREGDGAGAGALPSPAIRRLSEDAGR